jgi:hypothetical protein
VPILTSVMTVLPAKEAVEIHLSIKDAGGIDVNNLINILGTKVQFAKVIRSNVGEKQYLSLVWTFAMEEIAKVDFSEFIKLFDQEKSE